MNKRGVTPVVATILLISIVIVLAGIVFLWAQGFVKEGAEKFGEPIEQACNSVAFRADVYNEAGGYILEVNNQANVPIYGFNIKILGDGQVLVHETLPQTIDLGASARINLPTDEFAGSNELLVVPVLLGQKGEKKESFPCPDSFGVGVTIV